MPKPTERLADLAALVGPDVGISDWKTIDQEMIDRFAALTGDDGPIHTDPEEAMRVAPFGGTIVQGFMMMSHLTGFAKSLRIPQTGVAFRLNYGFDRVRIITPVPVGSRIRGRFTIDQTKKPPIKDQWVSLGNLMLAKGKETAVEISNEDAEGYVIIDAVQFIPKKK